MLQRKVPPPPKRFWGKKIRRLSFCRRVRTSCVVALTELEALPIGLQQGTFLSRPEQPAHSMHAWGGGQLTSLVASLARSPGTHDGRPLVGTVTRWSRVPGALFVDRSVILHVDDTRAGGGPGEQ